MVDEMRKFEVVRRLTEVVKTSTREKVVRVAYSALRVRSADLCPFCAPYSAVCVALWLRGCCCASGLAFTCCCPCAHDSESWCLLACAA